MRKPVVDRRRTSVGRYSYGSVGLGNAISDRRSSDVVVVSRACETPAVAAVGPDVGVRRVAHVNRAHRGACLPVHTGDRVSRCVRKAGVSRGGTGIRCDIHRRAGLGDVARAAR